MTAGVPHLKNADIVLVMGLPASGKTSLAALLAEKLGALHLSSDALRAELLKRGRYALSDKESVYDEMYRRAASELRAGGRVVLDATFHLAYRRGRFRQLAASLRKQLVTILVEAGEEAARQRLQQKRHDSEADWRVYLLLKSEYEPPDHVWQTVRTDQEVSKESLVNKLLTI